MIFIQKLENLNLEIPESRQKKRLPPLSKNIRQKQNAQRLISKFTQRSCNKKSCQKNNTYGRKLKNCMSSKLFEKAHQKNDNHSYLSPDRLSCLSSKSKNKQIKNPYYDQPKLNSINKQQVKRPLSLNKQINIKIDNKQQILMAHDISDIIMNFNPCYQKIEKIDKQFDKKESIKQEQFKQKINQSFFKLLEKSN